MEYKLPSFSLFERRIVVQQITDSINRVEFIQDEECIQPSPEILIDQSFAHFFESIDNRDHNLLEQSLNQIFAYAKSHSFDGLECFEPIFFLNHLHTIIISDSTFSQNVRSLALKVASYVSKRVNNTWLKTKDGGSFLSDLCYAFLDDGNSIVAINTISSFASISKEYAWFILSIINLERVQAMIASGEEEAIRSCLDFLYSISLFVEPPEVDEFCMNMFIFGISTPFISCLPVSYMGLSLIATRPPIQWADPFTEFDINVRIVSIISKPDLIQFPPLIYSVLSLIQSIYESSEIVSGLPFEPIVKLLGARDKIGSLCVSKAVKVIYTICKMDPFSIQRFMEFNLISLLGKLFYVSAYREKKTITDLSLVLVKSASPGQLRQMAKECYIVAFIENLSYDDEIVAESLKAILLLFQNGEQEGMENLCFKAFINHPNSSMLREIANNESSDNHVIARQIIDTYIIPFLKKNQAE